MIIFVNNAVSIPSTLRLVVDSQAQGGYRPAFRGNNGREGENIEKPYPGIRADGGMVGLDDNLLSHKGFGAQKGLTFGTT
ncbi:MAG: hypothetical protein ACUVSH_10195, partial [Anaerolineae bacterium]